MCMHDCRILENVTSQKVYVVRRVDGDKIISPFRKNTYWVVGEKQILEETTLKYLEQIISDGFSIGNGVFHGYRYLEDATKCSKWFNDMEARNGIYFVIFEALAEGIIGEGVNDDSEECYFSTELTLLKKVYPEE